MSESSHRRAVSATDEFSAIRRRVGGRPVTTKREHSSGSAPGSWTGSQKGPSPRYQRFHISCRRRVVVQIPLLRSTRQTRQAHLPNVASVLPCRRYLHGVTNLAHRSRRRPVSGGNGWPRGARRPISSPPSPLKSPKMERPWSEPGKTRLRPTLPLSGAAYGLQPSQVEYCLARPHTATARGPSADSST